MTTSIPASRGPIAMSMTDNLADVRADWNRLAEAYGSSVYSSPDFVGPWAEHVASARGLEPRYVLARRAGEPIAVFPFALGKEGGVPMLVALSDSHANMNGGVYAGEWDARPEDLHRAILSLEPSAEGIWVCCLPTEGRVHPLASGDQRSVHDAHGGSFAGGFEGHLSRNHAKRKRKMHRKAERAFDAAGGWSVRRLEDPVEAVRTLDEARTLFADRFRREGIADPFAAREVRDFMAAMVRDSIGEERPTLALWILEVGGRTLSIQAGGGSRDRFSLMFTVYRPSELDSVGPGAFLLHEVVKAAAEAGYDRFDLGRGREPYKSSWCDEIIPLHDVRVGRTARAKLWLAAHAQAAALKKRVRGNERLWQLAKTVRRNVGRAA